MTELTIERVVAGGDGLGRVDGAVCLVPYALPGDTVRAKDTARRGGVLRATIDEVLQPSPDRIEAACPVFGKCGGCTWLTFAYPAQAEAKREVVADCLRRIAGIDVSVGWADDPTLRIGYRTRATFHAQGGRIGFFESRSHHISDIASCPLCHPRLNAALAKLRGADLDGEFDVTVNPEGDDVLVWTRDRVPGLCETFPASDSNDSQGQRHQFTFDGAPIVCGGFSQASLLLNRVLKRVVHAYLANADSILDLYCGNGNLSLDAADGCRVLGLDHHGPSVESANAMGRAEYRRGNEASFVRAIYEHAWDVVLLDPPRQGAKAIVPALAQARSRRIVYVSCDPATLARDCRTLVSGGWTLQHVTAVDMFPHTAHVESVAVFGRPGEVH